MEYRDELAIAKQAEQMLTSSLKNRTSSFASHYKKKEGEVSLKDAFAKSVVKRYGKKKEGNQQIFMRRLVIRMARHGFVQHYGVDTIRAGGFRQRTKPKSILYHYKGHPFEMKATPFLDETIRQSGVIDFVIDNISRLRADTFAEELIFPIKNFTQDLDI